MARDLLLLAGVMGFLGVALGAFGAHGLEKRFAPLPDGKQRAAWWQTGAHYHLVHAAALGFVAAARIAVGSAAPSPELGRAGIAFAAGIALFSGSLYLMALTGKRRLGAVTPVGGVLFLYGWFTVGMAALRLAP